MKQKNSLDTNHIEKDDFSLIFTSFSKKIFYLRSQISAFVLQNKKTPVNPFMNFEYNLSGTVDKKHIRIANNTMIEKATELWVFGAISDGVLVEIYLAKKLNKKIRFFIPNEDVAQFKEISINEVELEDVSGWIWEYVLRDNNLERWHPRLRFKQKYPLIYPAYSKRNFYWQAHISKFCIERHKVPLNPFMLFKYFLSDVVLRKYIYEANAKVVEASDELWTFGELSDGMIAEIEIAKKNNVKVSHYKIIDRPSGVKFRKISDKGVVIE